MPQLFPRSTNLLSRLTLYGLVLSPIVAFGIGAILARSAWSTGVGVRPDQPVQFSHLHHVTDDGIDCRYCHASVETSAFAGMPTTETCMNCHRQIWNQSPALEPVRQSFATDHPLVWNRVNSLPDYVYFDHSIHVQKGVGCSTCHGRVDLMPRVAKAESLQMQWCIDCHTNPGPHLRPQSAIFQMDWQPPANQQTLAEQLMAQYDVQTRTSCSVCHR
jgi:hypothetical protein